MAYLKNWTDNFFQIFFMGTSWVAVSINNITTRASREMTSRKKYTKIDFNAISDCLNLVSVVFTRNLITPGLRNPPSTVPTGFPQAIPERNTTRLPRKGGYPQTRGGCHSSLGSSGDISISHSGVSCGHRNVPHASIRHYTTSSDSSGLCRPPSRTLLHYNGSFPSRPTPRSERLVCAAPAHPQTISLYGSSAHN